MKSGGNAEAVFWILGPSTDLQVSVQGPGPQSGNPAAEDQRAGVWMSAGFSLYE